MSSEIQPSNPKSVGLSSKELKHVEDILARMVQGIMKVEDLSYLETYRKKDEFGVMSKELDIIKAHPSFLSDEEIVENWHKNFHLRTRLTEAKHKTRREMSQTRSIDVRTINSMLKLNKPKDGERFGVYGAAVERIDGEPEFADDRYVEPKDKES